MPDTDIERLRSIRTLPSLIKYLRDELDWPIDSDDADDLYFDYEPEELGLHADHAVKIKEIKQLRPLDSNQPWGIFWVNFEKKRLPMVVLRRVLGNLVVKKRKSANKTDRPNWQLNDLLFISSYGEEEHRTVSFAHFVEDPETDELPVLRVLGWDDQNSIMHLDRVANRLHTQFRWPDDPGALDAWRKRWSEAFTDRYQEAIRSAAELIPRLAQLARGIRKRVKDTLDAESEHGPMRRLLAAVRGLLIHDMDEDAFSDMYAQTVAYGLLSARFSRPAGLTAQNLVQLTSVSNPFLENLLENLFRLNRGKFHFDVDEVGINDVLDLLRKTNIDAIKAAFNDENPAEDPVIRFYEGFLKEYDSKQRIQRGIFFTPRPVVSYIVRSVHELLQTEFSLEDGLASTATWADMLKKFSNLQLPEGVKPDDSFVSILDPATGTGTFLFTCIEVIERTMKDKWCRELGKKSWNDPEILARWREYVPRHLLPRLYGYELMMAPYAIAHLKLALKLGETGYQFRDGDRLHIYLTNSLEPASEVADPKLADLFATLAKEAQEVNDIKRHKCFTVVIGNPPYAGISSNMTEQSQRLVDAYKVVDGEALNERKLWLQDDYVKFIRTAQTTIEQAQTGILGYITNHGYLDNPTFRGMRQSLMTTFQRVRVLDLHGNANKKEQAPDGTEDKNVFDIRQGVSICVAARDSAKAAVQHSELWGLRETKYAWLASHSVGNTAFVMLSPDSPYYFFDPQNTDCRAEYDKGWKINEAMPVNCAGFITARDHFVVDFDRDTLLARIGDFANPKVSDAAIRATYFAGCGSDKYPDGDTRGWKVPEARRRVASDKKWRERVRTCLYRPFDDRQVYWADWMVDWPRPELTRHLDLGNNKAFITTRITKDAFSVFSTRTPPGHKSVGAYDVNYVFPLWAAAEHVSLLAQGARFHPNFALRFAEAVASSLKLAVDAAQGLPVGLTPEDIFHYIYAVFHSPCYRSRYAEFLKIDFPRLPLTGNLELFRALASLGGELVALHLLESAKLDKHITEFVGGKNPEVEKISWAKKTVWIDKAQTTGFKGVPEELWKFHIGGYQVCEKWLKDRKGRTLTKDDIVHYHKIVGALSETIRLMSEIDKMIEQHGGWPGAFVK